MDPYTVLGLSPAADDVVIHAAWKALLRKYHPDASSDARSAARACEINEAFALLGTPESRAAYDQTLRPRAPGAARPPMPPGAAHFRSAPRRHLTGTRFAGALLLLAAAVPTALAGLLAYPDTSAATHELLLSWSQGRPLARRLVRRLDMLVPSPAAVGPTDGNAGAMSAEPGGADGDSAAATG